MDNIHRNQNEIDELNEKIITLDSNVGESSKTFEISDSDLQTLTSRYEKEENEVKQLSDKLQIKKDSLDSLNLQYREQLTAVSKHKEITQQTKYQISWNKEQIRIFDSENQEQSESKDGLLKKLKALIF